MNKSICLIICFLVGVLVFMMIRDYCSCDVEGYCCKAVVPPPPPSPCVGTIIDGDCTGLSGAASPSSSSSTNQCSNSFKEDNGSYYQCKSDTDGGCTQEDEICEMCSG